MEGRVVVDGRTDEGKEEEELKKGRYSQAKMIIVGLFSPGQLVGILSSFLRSPRFSDEQADTREQ